MIGKLAALICALALVNIASAGSDPIQASAICAAEGSDGILVAHEDCSRFYECSGTKAVVFDCPLNLLYNPEKQYCDWAEKVNCKVEDPVAKPDVGVDDEKEVVNDKINSDPSEAAEICAAQGSDGILVAHEDCRKFYKCFQGEPAVLDCPVNLLYNPAKEYCDWAENVDCKVKNPEVPVEEVQPVDINAIFVNDRGNSDPSKAPEICAEKGSDGILIAHEQCSKFYKCSEGLPAALDCPGILLYNPEREYCDWPQNVNCGNRT